MKLQNGVLGKYIQTIIRNGHEVSFFYRRSCKDIEVVMKRRVYEFETYLYNLEYKMDERSILYWKKYGHIAPKKL